MIQFNEKSHRYFYEKNLTLHTLTGDKRKKVKVYVPSVTTILNVINKPALIPWAVRTTVDYIGTHLDELKNSLTAGQANDIFNEAKQASKAVSQEAMDIGTQVHEAIECFFKGEAYDLTTMPDPARKAYSSFLDWVNGARFKCEATEVRLYNEQDNYAGTCDAVGTIDGDVVLIDFKTGSGIYPEATLQVSAYARAYSLKNVDIIQRAYIVRFGKDSAQFEVKEIDREGLREEYSAFMCALGLYNWQKNNR
jgi:hypothetical protein